MTDSERPAWTVTQQVETTDIGPDGTYVSGTRVTVRTAAGSLVSVFVPASQYTVEAVRAAIAARVAAVDAVNGLTE